mgnify:CR=1 FL=1
MPDWSGDSPYETSSLDNPGLSGYGGDFRGAHDDEIHLFNRVTNDPIELYVLNNVVTFDGFAAEILQYTQPEHGSASMGGSGDYLVYTPAGNLANDSFTYTISTGTGATSTATVYLHELMTGGYGRGLSGYGSGVLDAVEAALTSVSIAVDAVSVVTADDAILAAGSIYVAGAAREPLRG